MRAELENAAARIDLHPVELEDVMHRGRRTAAVRATALTLTSVVAAAVLVAGGLGARALVQDDAVTDVTAPSTPPAVSAEALGPTDVVVSWESASDDVGVTEYEIVRDGDEIDTVEGATLSFTDDSVEPKTTYGYRIVARDNAGNRSPPSPIARVTTPALPKDPDRQPPSTPVLRARPTGPREVVLEWTPATDNVDLAGYAIYRDGVAIDEVDETLTIHVDNDVEPGSTRTYEVDAFDVAGNRSSRSNAVVVEIPPEDTQPPTAPADVSVDTTNQGALVSWTASTDDVGVGRYVISRNGTQIGTVDHPTTTFVDDSDLCEGSFTYEVVAVDAAGNVSAPGFDQISVVC